MKYYCNPINVPYRYQFNMDPRSHGKLQIDREAADPSMIQFQGKYYIFASMNCPSTIMRRMRGYAESMCTSVLQKREKSAIITGQKIF